MFLGITITVSHEKLPLPTKLDISLKEITPGVLWFSGEMNVQKHQLAC